MKTSRESSKRYFPAEKSYRRVLRVVLGAVIIVPVLWFAAIFLIDESVSLPEIGMRDAPTILSILLSVALVMVCNGLILRDLVGSFGVRLDVVDWLGITMVASMLNLLSPIKGAAATRAIYLKRVHQVDYSTFVCLLGISVLCGIGVSGLLAVSSLIALGVPGGRLGWVAVGVSASISIASIGALLFASGLRLRASSPLRRLSAIAESWMKVIEDKALVLRVVLWSALGALLHALAFILAFRLAGFDGSWLVPVTSSAFARIGALISITPAGLGVFEAFGAVSAQIVGAAPGLALIGVLMVRLAGTVVSLVGGALFSMYLLRRTVDSKSASSES